MAAPLPESDGDLVRLALEGRQDAFSALYERYFPSVFDFITRLLRNREEAADVAQDTFIKAMEQLPTLKNPDRFKSWIFTIAHRTGLNRIRSSKRTATVGGSVDDDERSTMAVADADPSIDPEKMAAIQEASDIVWEAAAGLDARTYAVLDLHVRHGLDSAEIAEVLGVSKGNAYTMVSRMKQTFSKTLSTYLLVRNGRQDCPTLASVIGPDVDQMTPELRKRADRHVKKCDRCSNNRVFYLEPLKMFAALMLVPVPAGLKGAIWGSVAAAGAAGAAGAGTAAAAGGAGTTGGAGGAGAATGAAAAASQVTTAGTFAAVAAMAAAVVAGAVFLTVLGTQDTPPSAAPPSITIFEEPQADSPLANVATPPGSSSADANATTSTTTTTTTTVGGIAAPPATPTTPPTPTTLPPSPTPTTPPTPTTLPPPPPPPAFAVANDSAAVAEDTTLVLNVLANDVGPIDSATLELTAAPMHGSAATTADGEILYTPALDYVGADQLAYSVTDTLGRSGSATVDVTVLPINDAPVVPGPGDIITDEDATLTFDPLNGAFDVDGDELVMSAFDKLSAAGGTIEKGSLIYTPPENYFGADTFSYTVSDGTASVVVTVALDVAPVPDPPVPPDEPISFEVDEDTVAKVDLLDGWSDPDGDELEAARGTFPTDAGGTVAITAKGKATYTPPPDFHGSDSFAITVTDGTFDIVAKVAAVVAPVNDPPSAVDATFVAAEDISVGTALGTIVATDPDGDDLAFDPVTGAIAIDGSGTVTVGAPLDFETSTSHTATTTVSDGNGGQADVTVTLQVTGVNEAPAIADSSVTIAEGTPTGSVVATLVGTDPDGDDLTYAISGGDPEGVFSVDASTGELTFVQAPLDEPFPTQLTVTVTDPDGLSDQAAVTIEVIDNTGPAITDFATDRRLVFSGIEPDQECPAGQHVANLTASVSDPSGISFVRFAYSGTIVGVDLTGILTATLVDDAYTAGFAVYLPDSLDFLMADFAVTAEAADTFGNTSSLGGVTVTVLQCPTERPT